MAHFFSAIIWRIDSILIALEGFDILGLTVKPDLALEAVTKDSDNTEEHRAEQLHVQRGMGKNYERLEFIGDCFLKMATSITLFSTNPEDNEFEYHVRRMLMICNKNLFRSALAIKIHEYIRSKAFSRYVQNRACYPKESQSPGTASENMNFTPYIGHCAQIIFASLDRSFDWHVANLSASIKFNLP